MSENKIHHFVPQFYLRRFASDDRQLSIGLFMIGRSKLIRRTSIRTQANRYKLYGPTTREKMIGAIEGMCATSISKMLEQRAVPEAMSHDHMNLLMHVLLQSGRTPEAGEQWELAVNEFMRTTVKQKPNLPFDPELLDKVRIRITQPVDEAMFMRVTTLPSLIDLKYALLLNRTACPFITSDHPVVFYNQFFERRKQTIGSGGAASKGLQIFFPLSPTHYLMFYDSSVYDYGKGIMKGIAVKATEADVRALNGLQIITAQDHLYFDSSTSETEIRGLINEFRPKRQYMPPLQKTYAIPGMRSNPDGTFSTFTFSSTETLQIGLKLTCIAEKPDLKKAAIRPNGHHFRTKQHYALLSETNRRYLREHPGNPSRLGR